MKNFLRRRNKYGARSVDGFPSKLERAVYGKLIEREMLGLIKDVQRYPSVELQEGPPRVRISWKIDFCAVDTKTNELFFIEAKGLECGEFKLKLKLFIAKKIGRLEIWKGKWQKPFLARVVDPREEAA